MRPPCSQRPVASTPGSRSPPAPISSVGGSAITWIGGRFSVRGVQFALLTIAFAELLRVIFDNWDLVGGTGGYFLKAINPDTNQPL